MNTENTGGMGRLTVRVTTARGAVPLAGAGVSVREYSEPDAIFLSGTTDGNGNTRTFDLPTPRFANSQKPNGGQAYSTYNIVVSYKGYGSVYFYNVPVFPDTMSLQQAYLVPLAENGTSGLSGRSEDTRYYTENSKLGGGRQ